MNLKLTALAHVSCCVNLTLVVETTVRPELSCLCRMQDKYTMRVFVPPPSLPRPYVQRLGESVFARSFRVAVLRVCVFFREQGS